jgi:WD40 repeat protein
MSADPTKLKVVRQQSRSDILFCVARVPGSTVGFVGSSDAKVYTVDLAAEKPEPKEVAAHGSYVTGLALTEKYVISGGYDHQLIWTDRESWKPVRTVGAHERWIRQVVASPDRKVVASIADDMVCRLWDVASGKRLQELRGHEAVTPHHYPSMLYACAFSADGKLLATGDKVGRVVIWDVATGKEVTRLDAVGMYTWDPTQRRHSIGGIRSVAFSPDGTKFIVGGMGKVGNIDHPDAPARLEIFDLAKRERTHEVLADGKLKGMVEQLVFHPSGDWFVGAGGGYGGFVLFYDMKANKILFQDTAPMRVHGLVANEACDTLFAAGHNKLITWELKTAESKADAEKKPSIAG